VIETYNMDYL